MSIVKRCVFHCWNGKRSYSDSSRRRTVSN